MPSPPRPRLAGFLGGGLLAAGLFYLVFLNGQPAKDDPLPSWNDRPAKRAILDFVERVTREGGLDFVAVPERVATFDNDGTLWSEQPIYFQFLFAIDRVKELAPKHPEWKDRQPFKAALAGDFEAVAASGHKGLTELVDATHAGMTSEEFERVVAAWLKRYRHPRFDRPLTDLAYQPMLELLAYLRASGFKTYIVSGGGLDFMRVFTGRLYGVVPEQVVGTSLMSKYEVRDGKPVLFREPKRFFLDDGPGKAVGIHRHIGRRPVMAFGNSDGDFEMLQWTTSAPGPRFGLIVRHTDGVREWAYDRKSPVGRLERALDEAPKAGWHVVDMAKDWRVIYPFEKWD